MPLQTCPKKWCDPWTSGYLFSSGFHFLKGHDYSKSITRFTAFISLDRICWFCSLNFSLFSIHPRCQDSLFSSLRPSVGLSVGPFRGSVRQIWVEERAFVMLQLLLNKCVCGRGGGWGLNAPARPSATKLWPCVTCLRQFLNILRRNIGWEGFLLQMPFSAA